MNIGTPPTDDHVLSGKESKMASIWSAFFDQLSSQLTSTFTNLGYFVSGTSASKMDEISGDYKKSIVYNDSLSRMEINNAGTFEPIQTYTLKTTAEINQLAQDSANIGKIYINSDTHELQFHNGNEIRTIASTT